MPSEDRTNKVAEFFEDPTLQKKMRMMKDLVQHMDREIAEILNSQVGGDVLMVGGCWEYFEWRRHLKTLTVLDISESMMKSYAPAGSQAIVGDLYSHEFPEKSFDSIVFPLILHHVADKTWTNSEQRVVEAIERAKRWLKPEGNIYILECCPAPAWYPLQRFLLPLTRVFLNLIHQPLVIMHTENFYVRSLKKYFRNSRAIRIRPRGRDVWMFYPVFMAVSWLRIPYYFFPKYALFIASDGAHSNNLSFSAQNGV